MDEAGPATVQDGKIIATVAYIEDLINEGGAVDSTSKEEIERWLKKIRRLDFSLFKGEKEAWARAQLDSCQRILQKNFDDLTGTKR